MPVYDPYDFTQLSATEIIALTCRRLREYRLRLGLTQKQLAEMTGLRKVTISRIERGVTDDMSMRTFLLLLKVLGNIRDFETLLPELPESPYGRNAPAPPPGGAPLCVATGRRGRRPLRPSLTH